MASTFLSLCVKSAELTAKAQQSSVPTCVRDGHCLPAAGPTSPAAGPTSPAALLRGCDRLTEQ